ncbi:MAG: AI-2E family transporter, partial [Oscillospiraceae bacterium]|nr:AI-2E family transporter [Oscillospiraceae bacterium]
MDMPYALLIAAVCSVTDLIPFFGPFIGAIPCGFLILLVDPIKVIWFGIFVLVLQQIDGNIIRPFLLEETMGLPATWALISIIAGGGLFGIPGMLLGVPIFTVIYMLFSEFLSNKLKAKKLPISTEDYYDIKKYDTNYGAEPPTESSEELAKTE